MIQLWFNDSFVMKLPVTSDEDALDQLWTVWPDWAIFCTLSNFLKPLATMNLPKSLTFLGNFCKGLKIYQFSSEIIFGQL